VGLYHHKVAFRLGIGIIGVFMLGGFRARSVAEDSTGKAQASQAAPGSGTSQPVEVSGVTIGAEPSGATFVEVLTSSQTTYRLKELKQPERLVVDLEGAQKASPRRFYNGKSPLLRRVRVSQFRAKDPAVVRLVADLANDPIYEVNKTARGVRIALKPRRVAQGAVAQQAGSQAPAAPQRAPSQVPPQEALPVKQKPPSTAPQEAPQATPQPIPPPPAQVAAPPPPMPPAPIFRKSPFRSLPQNEKLLDALALKIVLSLNYRKGGADEAAWKTKGAPGVGAVRLLMRPLGPGSYRTLELAVSPSPQGGYELVLYGLQSAESGQGANPDMIMAQQLLNTEIAQVEQAPASPDMLNLSYETYNLSYVIADRAIALLKTLGYTTVEYSGQAGESLFQTVYNPLKLGSGKPPIIVKLIDSTKTSLLEPAPSGAPGAPAAAVMPQMAQPAMGVGGQIATSTLPSLGGTYLHQMTSGEPQERLLILYDKDDPESLQALTNLLQSTVDVPSREVLIEALVVELNSTRARQLGTSFLSQQNQANVTAPGTAPGYDPTLGLYPSPINFPFIFSWDKNSPQIATFQAQLNALLQTNQAQILSNPSVLVLDDRQARIQIGQQIPVVNSTATAAGVISSTNYFPTGIVLNLRPRISDDGSDITMQAETIVSSPVGAVLPSTVLYAPPVNNRQVQTIVRVADDTPFIIGGLISTNDQKIVNGIPLLSQIPLVGALFRNQAVIKIKQEVIIVVTPHVVPLEDKYFSYVIPKDSSQFDRLGNTTLYRNAYRIRGSDVFDLEFIRDSNVFKQLVNRVTTASAANPDLRKTEPFATVLKGGAPGEEILVHRMLWEIIDRTHYAQYVSPDKILFFENNPSGVGGRGFQYQWLRDKLKNLKKSDEGIALTFEAQPQGTEERPFVYPKATVSYPTVAAESYPDMLIRGNDRNPDGTPHDWMVLLSKNYSGIRRPPLEVLQGVIVLKRVLELNSSMPMSLKETQVGREIIFPSQEELQVSYHFIDREVARLFYEVFNYYPAFEEEFNREARYINSKLANTNQP